MILALWILLAPADLPLDRVSLPEGFEITVYAEVPEARSIALGSKGTVFVGNRTQDKVYAVASGVVRTLDEGLFMPNGVAFHGGSLFVAEVNRILRYDRIEERLEDPPEPVVVLDGLPNMRHHGWKYLAFGPDGRLYFNVGAPCNVCESVEPVFASIASVKPDGRGLEVVASGVRNSVGFDWEPETGRLWFTDNGRDWLGDDAPGDELNVVTGGDQHFGYPYCHGDGIADPYFGEKRGCSDFTAPAKTLDPHVAAIGMKFYRGDQFPETYRGRIFIAEHGSWNRTDRIGYRIMTVTFDGESVSSYEPFATGFIGEADERPWGRPVDLLELTDGSLLVSDDRAEVLYQIRYRAP